jgi:hypothetical protein
LTAPTAPVRIAVVRGVVGNLYATGIVVPDAPVFTYG